MRTKLRRLGAAHVKLLYVTLALIWVILLVSVSVSCVAKAAESEPIPDDEWVPIGSDLSYRCDGTITLYQYAYNGRGGLASEPDSPRCNPEAR